MNASELADKLSDKTMRDYIVFEYLPEIVSMLRKQQESIEGLNRDYDLLFAEHQLLLKKEWIGLTDEERQDIALEVPIDAVFITEAVLKDKHTRMQQ